MYVKEILLGTFFGQYPWNEHVTADDDDDDGCYYYYYYYYKHHKG